MATWEGTEVGHGVTGARDVVAGVDCSVTGVGDVVAVVGHGVTGVGDDVAGSEGQHPSSTAAPANAPIAFKKLRRVMALRRFAGQSGR